MTRQPIGIHGYTHQSGGQDPVQLVRELIVVIDGSGAVVTAGVKGEVSIDFTSTITSWRILANDVGSVVLDIWKTDYASYPPTVADTITGSSQPALTSQDKNEDSTLAGWTTGITAGDTLRFNVDSASTVTRVELFLSLQET